MYHNRGSYDQNLALSRRIKRLTLYFWTYIRASNTEYTWVEAHDSCKLFTVYTVRVKVIDRYIGDRRKTDGQKVAYIHIIKL